MTSLFWYELKTSYFSEGSVGSSYFIVGSVAMGSNFIVGSWASHSYLSSTEELVSFLLQKKFHVKKFHVWSYDLQVLKHRFSLDYLVQKSNIKNYILNYSETVYTWCWFVLYFYNTAVILFACLNFILKNLLQK